MSSSADGQVSLKRQSVEVEEGEEITGRVLAGQRGPTQGQHPVHPKGGHLGYNLIQRFSSKFLRRST